jgi:hypothetical protein
MIREPMAFLSYVRADDDHDEGRISGFRKRLEGEVRMQTGKPFAIFQDRNDIAWGINWEDRINTSLASVTFLIPVITPSFFQSPACRKEFEIFLLREKTLGMNRLILPLYYVTCDQFDDTYVGGTDNLVDTLRARNWTDWRDFRFRPFGTEDVSNALAKLATMIKTTAKELESIFVVADATKVEETIPVTIKPVKRRKARKALLASTPPSKEFIEELVKHVKIPVPALAEIPDLEQQNRVRAQGYYAYTRRFDEEIRASELAPAGMLLELHQSISKEATRLQNTYKDEIEKFQKAVRKKGSISISFLCDNSGSMRGSPIYKLASWMSILIDVLESMSIPNEVLGYTTRAWKGGQTRELWLKDGKPKLPGRLNDLRHIIYKSFGESARVAAPNLGVMVREGVLKENIDGEALLWAYSRLSAVESDTKLIVVLADGESVDDSTISTNPNTLLPAHAAAVSRFISSKSDIRLMGVGIDHDVSSIYQKAVRTSPQQLGLAVLDALKAYL